MTIPFLTQEQLTNILKNNGWAVVSDEAWDTHNRIMFGKEGHSFPMQLKPTYFYPEVVIMLESLGIEPPADHKRCYEQYKELKRREKEAKANKENKDE